MNVTLKTPYIKDIVFAILENNPDMDYHLFKYRLSKTEFSALKVQQDTFNTYKSLYKNHLKGIPKEIQENTKYHLRSTLLIAIKHNPNITYDQFIEEYNIKCSASYFYSVLRTYKVNRASGIRKRIFTPYCQIEYVRRLLFNNSKLTFEDLVDYCPFYVDRDLYFRIIKERDLKLQAVAAKPKANEKPIKAQKETVPPKASEQPTNPQKETVPPKANSLEPFNEHLEYIISGYETIKQVLDFLGRNAGLTKANKKFLLLKLSQGLDAESKDISWLRNTQKLS